MLELAVDQVPGFQGMPSQIEASPHRMVLRARHINSSIDNGPLMPSQIEAYLHRMVLMAPHVNSTINNGPLLPSQK